MNKLLGADDFITEAVNEYSDTIYRIALNITRSSQDSFDVCQEVFIRLIKNKHKIKNDQHLKAWLIRTSVNCAKSICTQAYNRHTIGIDEVRESVFVQENEEIPLTEMVMTLPEKYSTVIYLFYYEDMKILEIARSLGVTQSAVKARLARGRKKLKEILEKENYYE